MGANDYSPPRITNIPHENPNYGYRQPKFEIDYYRHKYYFLKNLLTHEEN